MTINPRQSLRAALVPLALGLFATSACKQAPRSAGAELRRSRSALNCSTALPDGPRTFDLWARAGQVALQGRPDPLAVWGYASSDAEVPAAPGGPVLVVRQGDLVTVTLHNALAEPTALLFQGQQLAPDLAGAAAGADKAYTFTAGAPGTYLYEAGLLANAQHQVAMGLYGALVVRPAAGSCQAYGADTAFDYESVLVLGEIDPALNAAPAAFDMRNYAPKYFLINGLPYPQTQALDFDAPGKTVLLRYVNAGIQHHSMALLGLRQELIATGGSPRAAPASLIAETIAPGQTQDMLVRIPAATAAGTRFALYDGSLKLHNNGGPGFGGMLTFLTVGAPAAPIARGNPGGGAK